MEDPTFVLPRDVWIPPPPLVVESVTRYVCLDSSFFFTLPDNWLRHLASELHFKNSLPHQQIPAERPARCWRSQPAAILIEAIGQGGRKPRANGHLKNVECRSGSDRELSLPLNEAECCPSCGARVHTHQLGKHLVSHFHYHR